MDRDKLNDTMDFDHIVWVHADGTVTDGTYVRGVRIGAPELMWDGTDVALMPSCVREGWELLTGRTGQYGYHGPVMHASEYVGGNLADWILSHPGLYVTLVAYAEEDAGYDAGTDASADGPEPAGWCVAHRTSGI